MITVTIDNRLRLLKSHLPAGHEAAIKARLTVTNGEKAAAEKRRQWGWEDLPDSFALYEDDGDYLILPRGYAAELRAGLKLSGEEVVWDDQRSAPHLSLDRLVHQGPELRPEQETASQSIELHKQGILQAPPACVTGDTKVSVNRAGKGSVMTIEHMYRKFHGSKGVGRSWDRSIPTYCRALVDGVFRQHRMVDVVDSGIRETIVVTLESGKRIQCTADHKILLDRGWQKAGDLLVGDLVTTNGTPACKKCRRSDRKIITGSKYAPAKYPGYCMSCAQSFYRPPKERIIEDGRALVPAPIDHPRAFRRSGKRRQDGWIFEHLLVAEEIIGRPVKHGEHVHHKDKNPLNNDPSNLEVLSPSEHAKRHSAHVRLHGTRGGRGGEVMFVPKHDRVASIVAGGVAQTYDLVMESPHNNFVANGMVVHNSGKTIVVLETWRRSGLTGLILVEKAQLATQWRERAREHLGIETGMIGEGAWEEGDLTIAMMQTLRRRELDENWWRQWGFTAGDEIHHARAETYNRLIRQVRSRYFIGVTATPLEDMWEQPFLTRTVGPIFHITTDEQLRRAGRRVTPMVKRIRTEWHWKPDAKQAKLVDTKVIYRHILKALEADYARVGKIAMNIIDQPPECAQLVLCRSLAYLDAIQGALWSAGYSGDVHMLRGAERGEKAQQIAEAADVGGCVILSTVATEGTDIPRLDRLHLVWPQRQELGLKQAIGRILRTHPDKRGSIVFDYVDEEGILANQARLRSIFYRKSGYDVQEEREMQVRFPE